MCVASIPTTVRITTQTRSSRSERKTFPMTLNEDGEARPATNRLTPLVVVEVQCSSNDLCRQTPWVGRNLSMLSAVLGRCGSGWPRFRERLQRHGCERMSVEAKHTNRRQRREPRCTIHRSTTELAKRQPGHVDDVIRMWRVR